MFSYVFMKILEGRPRSYDQGMRLASAGRTLAMKQQVAAALPPGRQVLEIGCGTGELAAMLVEKGATVVGFDANPAMLAMARQRLEDENIGDRLELVEIGVEAMDRFDDGAFGAVVSTLVFSELSRDERLYALKNAHRVLEPGGLLVLVVEVVPRTSGRRAVQSLFRAPGAVAAYLVSRATTKPVPDLAGEVARAGFLIESEERSHGDSVALVAAYRPERGGES